MESKTAAAMFSVVLFVSVFLIPIAVATDAIDIGITYNTTPIFPPPHKDVDDALFRENVPIIRFTDINSNVVELFEYKRFSFFFTVPNSLLPSMSENRSAALTWVKENVFPFHPGDRIKGIAVGTDFLSNGSLLVSAIENIRLSLTESGIPEIPVSTIFDFFNLIDTPIPPSQARFKPSVRTVLKPLLDLLHERKSHIFMSFFPQKFIGELPIGFLVFQKHNNNSNYIYDNRTNLKYYNGFDIMVDAAIIAMLDYGHLDIPILAETGWPCDEESYCRKYISRLVKHVTSGKGTPLRKEGVKGVYLYQMVDYNNEKGENWGLFKYPSLDIKFSIDFTGVAIDFGLVGYLYLVSIGSAFIIFIYLHLCCVWWRWRWPDQNRPVAQIV